ncbi:MAG TPA: IclR family transcriptional regulator [Microvirga sp.]|jgi:DNA-binding IclR family transcriptional regulator|nr:IclR family transcriptional regulator [Microvirga sp.]
MKTNIRTVDGMSPVSALPVRAVGPRSVERVTEALNLLSRWEAGYSLAELARRLEVPKASLADLLAGLVACDFVSRTPGGRFKLGPAALAFARQAVSSTSFSDFTHHHLEALVKTVKETALVARLDEENMVSVYVDKVESEHSVRYTVPIGLRRELFATSAGKVLLAHLQEGDQAAYLRSVTLERFTPRTIVDRKALRRELDLVVDRGVATTEDERSVGASGVAAPIFDSDGHVLGALAVAGPTARMQLARDQIVSLVQETAQRISDVFGQARNA